MSSGNSKRIVLNSYRFFRDITPEMLGILPSVAAETGTSAEGVPELYSVIRANNHRIIITTGIQNEYFREAERVGISETLILTLIQQLEREGLIMRPRLPGGRRNMPGLPQRHRILLADSILSRADYFVMENPVWLRLANMMLREHRVRVITPGGFILRESI